MLSPTQGNTIIKVLSPYSPKKTGVFGPFARGEEHEASDIDILYDFTNEITLFQLAQIKMELEEK